MISLKHKIKNFLPKRKIKIHIKGISTLIGAGCINFLIGAIFSICTLAIYEISYVKAKGGSIEIENITFYYPIELFFQCISSFLSGYIYKRLGLHLTNLLGVIILSSGYYLMYISTSLAFDLISMALGGMGTGIIFYPSTTNAYEWFSDHNGLIVGIMETMISFGSFFFSFIGERIINKNERESNDENNLYDIEIAEKMKYYLLVLIICLISAFIISFLLMFKKKSSYDNLVPNYGFIKKEKQNKNGIPIINSNIVLNNKKESKNENLKEISSDDKKDKNNSINEQDLDEEKEGNKHKKEESNTEFKKEEKENNTKKKDLIETSKDENNNKNSKHIKEDKIIEPYLKRNIKEIDEDNNVDKNSMVFKIALKSIRLKLFCAIVILQAPVSNMAFTLYREIGEYKGIDTKYLQLIGSYYFIFECLSAFIFGILSDYIKLKYLLLFINIIGTLTGYIYCFTFKNSLIFFLAQNFISFTFGGYYSIKDCYLLKVFGNKIYIELSSFVSLMDAFAINILTPLTYFILSKFDDKDKAYWTLFISFGTMNLIGLILNLFLKENRINLNERIQRQKENMK